MTESQAAERRRTQPVAPVAITGLGFSPTYVWMTKEARPRLFALVHPGWFRLIDSRLGGQGRRLERLQLRPRDEALEGLARRLAHRAEGTLLIRNARVFDAEKAKLLPPATSTSTGTGSPPSTQPDRRPIPPPPWWTPAATPCCRGCSTCTPTTTPGGRVLHVAAGVTTVRDMANDNGVLGDLITRINAGQSVGPRILPAGFIEGNSEHAAKHGFVADNIDDVRRAIDWYAQHGYKQIKLYNSFRREWVSETTAYAHQRGLRVSGHVPAFMRAEEVVQLGYDEIQHANQLMLNFLVKPRRRHPHPAPLLPGGGQGPGAGPGLRPGAALPRPVQDAGARWSTRPWRCSRTSSSGRARCTRATPRSRTTSRWCSSARCAPTR